MLKYIILYFFGTCISKSEFIQFCWAHQHIQVRLMRKGAYYPDVCRIIQNDSNTSQTQDKSMSQVFRICSKTFFRNSLSRVFSWFRFRNNWTPLPFNYIARYNDYFHKVHCGKGRETELAILIWYYNLLKLIRFAMKPYLSHLNNFMNRICLYKIIIQEIHILIFLHLDWMLRGTLLFLKV